MKKHRASGVGTCACLLLLALGPVACGGRHGGEPSGPGPVEAASDPFPMPRGIYALGVARDDPATALDERLDGIRSYDFVSGYTLRVFWSDLDDGRGRYQFEVIDEALALLPQGQRLNLEVLPRPPDPVVSAAARTYVDERGQVTPLPWDPALQQAHAAFVTALADHRVAGTASRLADTQAVASVDNSVPGFSQGLRDINGRLRGSGFYDRQACVQAVLDAVARGRRAFPRKLGYLAFFAFDDGEGGQRVDAALIEQLAATYNGAGQPSLAFFVENLSDTGPLPRDDGVGTGHNLLLWHGRGGETMMQALTSWLQPFTGGDAVSSRNPATGIALAHRTYGTRFFELYVTDLDGAARGATDATGRALADDLRYWNDALKLGP